MLCMFYFNLSGFWEECGRMGWYSWDALGSLQDMAQVRWEAGLVMCRSLLPSMAVLPLASVEGQVYLQTTKPGRVAEDVWWRSTGKEVFFPSPTPCPAPLPVVHRLSLECFCLACGKICPSPPDSCCEDTFMFQQPMLGVSQHRGSSAAAPLPPGHWQPWCRRLGWGQGALLPHASRGTWKVQESCSAVCITSGAIQHQGVRKHFARRWSFFKLSVTILQPRGGKEKQPTKQAKKTFSRLQIGKFSDLKISWFFFFSPVILKL